MITLQEILHLHLPFLDAAKVKIVRHKDGRHEYRDTLKDKDDLLEYQRIQSKPVFKGCDYIITFKGLERARSVLFGIFKINGVDKIDNDYHYDLQFLSGCEDLIDRLVIDWGNNAIAWHQWYHKQQKEVLEILPSGYIGSFKGILDFVLEFDELKKLIQNPEANYEWHRHLSAVNGIYMILDEKTGQQYIGSAYGKEGIWQRWSNYVANGTGGNKELITLHKDNPTYHKNFKFSVLQTLPSNMNDKEVVAVEALYKQKLGSRVHGLNRN